MPYGPFEQIAPKAAAICRNLWHIWRDCSKELNWILILNNRLYVEWIIRIGPRCFFSFCYFVLHLSLVHWLQWHFRGSRAIDKVQLMDTCHNMLATIFPLYCSIIFYVALQRIIYWQSATDGHVCHNMVVTFIPLYCDLGYFLSVI